MFTEIISTYYEKVRCGGKRASVVSTRQKLLPQAIESISRSRTPPILSRAQVRFAMRGRELGKGQLAGFGECNMAKAHRCHGGGEAIAPLTRRALGGVGKGKEGKEI